jgi:4a-hydroxytetrahydrobiopterin dehydratase
MNTQWTTLENSLYKKMIFSDFSEAFAYMTRVAMLCEQQQHHVSWSNVWNTVEMHLSTHDAGNIITDKDYKLAQAIDGITNK